METSEEDPITELDILVKALSEMVKPYEYVVSASLDFCAPPALDIKSLDGEWIASMCVIYPKDISFTFPNKKSTAAALISNYESSLTWDAQFFNNWKVLRFPGGSPAEMALKAAIGIKAILCMN